MTDAPAPSRIATWLDRWGDILPLLVAEFVVWLGFGGLLPVLPLYFTEQGLDFATLDYNDDAPVLYIGKAVDFDELRLGNVRTFEGW